MTTSRRPKYPFVFDLLSEAQQTSAFLANVKVSQILSKIYRKMYNKSVPCRNAINF